MRQIFLPADDLSPVVSALHCLSNVLRGLCNSDGKYGFSTFAIASLFLEEGRNTQDLQPSIPSEILDLPSRVWCKVKFKKGNEMCWNDEGELKAGMDKSIRHMKRQERFY